MTRTEILELQKSLNQSGFAFQVLGEPLTEDGIYGPNTDCVYRAWLDRDTSVPTVAPTPAKPWWTSRAILGLAATVVAMIAGQFGFEIKDEQITQILLQVVELGGLIVAAWGTINRKGQIDPTLVARMGSTEVRWPSSPESQKPPKKEDPRGSFQDS